DPRNWTHTCRAQHDLFAHSDHGTGRELHGGSLSRSGVRVTIAIVGGTGAEGSGLAARWARVGEKVIIGSRDAQMAAAAAAILPEQIAGSLGPPAQIEISGAENAAACEAADIVVLTVPFENHVETLKRLKPVLRRGQILVDSTVPLASSV